MARGRKMPVRVGRQPMALDVPPQRFDLVFDLAEVRRVERSRQIAALTDVEEQCRSRRRFDPMRMGYSCAA